MLRTTLRLMSRIHWRLVMVSEAFGRHPARSGGGVVRKSAIDGDQDLESRVSEEQYLANMKFRHMPHWRFYRAYLSLFGQGASVPPLIAMECPSSSRRTSPLICFNECLDWVGSSICTLQRSYDVPRARLNLTILFSGSKRKFLREGLKSLQEPFKAINPIMNASASEVLSFARSTL